MKDARMRMSWVFQVMSLEFRRIFSYRADFWLHFFSAALIQILIAYFLWKAIFDHRGVRSIGGYDFATLMLYYLLTPLVDRMVRGQEGTLIAQEIYEGLLNRYLIYPVSFFAFRYATFFAASIVFFGQFLAALGIYFIAFGVPAGVNSGAGSIALGLVFIFFGGVSYFFLSVFLELIAFWADNVWSLLVLMRFILYLAGGGMIPLSFFPEAAQEAIRFTPFPYYINFPIRCLMGRVAPEEIPVAALVTAFWLVVFYLSALFLWKRGSREYTGVGI